MNDKIQASHLERRAAVYLRQSTLKQVHQHRESTARQYALQERARQLGWTADRIAVVDEDLGQSGCSVERRTGFQRLAEDVAHGQLGAIFALEVSRLARSSADWHRLLDLCGLADVVIVDEQSVYTPRDYNDRLLLGLKGTMSEAEQYWMRLRLEGGRLNKARRGALKINPPMGYVWDPTMARLRLHPDEQVQRALSLAFERFRIDGSARAVARYFERRGLKMPSRHPATGEMSWVAPCGDRVIHLLRNPFYAGAYVYGRSEVRARLVDGRVQRRRRTMLPQERWRICLLNHHASYIGWEEFMANQQKLSDNASRYGPTRRGAAREGHALLQGLLLCGRCGHRMAPHYNTGGRARYRCHTQPRCWSVSAPPVDDAVSSLFLEAAQPPHVELALRVVHEAERQTNEVDRQWKLRLDRVRYEARLAERRYKAVDPDNRVIARTLEHEWEEKARLVEELEREYEATRKRDKLELTDQDQARLLCLSKNLSGLWNAKTTTDAERKNLLRILVQQVTLTPVDIPASQTRIQLLWQTGAVTDLLVPRHCRRNRTPPDVVRSVRELATKLPTDRAIADELNRRGLFTGRARVWTDIRVRNLRYAYRIRRRASRSRPGPQPKPTR